MPIISVIVPVYNVEKYLHRCIDSILTQTFKDFELILVDDGSTDNSGNICDAYCQKDNRIIVIHQDNQGQAAARNCALNIAKGDYISFVDSDDYIHPQMFEVLIGIVSVSKSEVVLFQYVEGEDNRYFWEKTTSDYLLYNGKDYLRNCLLNNERGCWVLWDKLFSRDCFKDLRLPEGRKYEDNATVYKILYPINRIAVTDNVFYYYYTNQNSTTKSEFSEVKADWPLALGEMIEFFYSKNDIEICDCLTKRYFNEGVYFYNTISERFPESKRLNEIKLTLKRLFKRNKKRFGLTIKDSPQLYNIVYPYRSRNYWRLYSVISKLKRREK